MATPPIDPATQARLDALQAEVDKLRAGNRANSSTTGLNAATDFISNDKISAKIDAALSLLPESITSSSIFKNSIGTITDAAKLVGAIADQAVESADAVFNMYQSGVAIGMDQLSKTANDFGTTIDGLTKLLTRHGRVVSSMGIDATARLGREFLSITRNGADLGMSIDEANEAAISYAETVNNSGKMQQYNTTMLAEGAIKFSKAINSAAQASGQNVESIRAETVNRLGQADAFAIMQSMSVDEQTMFKENMAGMGSFNSEFNKTGDMFRDLMVQFNSVPGGSISGIQNPDALAAMAASGTLGLFEQAMRQTGQEQKDTLAEMGAIMADYIGKNTQLFASPDTIGMANFLSNVGRDVNAITAREGKAVDETAADIEATIADFDKSMNAINNAINDLAVSGFITFKDSLAYGAEAALKFADLISGASRYMLGNPLDFSAAEGSAGFSELMQRQLLDAFGGMAINGRPDGGGGNAEPASTTGSALIPTGMSAQDFLNNNRQMFGSQNPDIQELLRTVAAQARTESVSATLSPAAAFDQSGSQIAGGIANSFESNPAVGARIGGSIGMGILSYLNFDNIRTAIFGATPVTDISRAQTTEDNTADNRNSIVADTLVQQARTDRDLNQQQNMNMNNQLELMLTQLSMLNTNITDQTNALQNALSRNSNNVYT